MDILTGFLMEIAETLRAMSPYLLFGFLVAGVLHVMIRQETVERHLGGNGFLQVTKASLFGVPLPLCSCGVIPVAASLRMNGAGKGATTSFLISTPQTGVDSVFVTLSLLGPVYAVFRPVVAFLSGILGGSIVAMAEGDEQAGPAGEACTGSCCTTDSGGGRIGKLLRYGFRTLPRDINKALIIGILVAGAIGAVVPDDFFAVFLGGGIVAMLVMVVLGIPVYVCATASVPIAAALIAKGVSPGAALVFLMTGPATNAATILTVSKVMGRKTAVIYLVSVAVCAIAAGLLLDWIFQSPSVPPPSGMPGMLPGWLTMASAFVLTLVMAASFVRGRAPALAEKDGTGALTLNVKGMHCQHCVESVKRAVLEKGGAAEATVDLDGGIVEVKGDGLDRDRLAGLIEELGYEVTGGKPPGEDER